ncbi:MAG: helix-turn-helix domain-containing protein [Rubellimicrobium sp.]|nr:helix-turn-helix domain-containing protein [Rubellimicrobium sp.]
MERNAELVGSRQATPAASSSHERHFYAKNRAIGRFGMRIFTPYLMEAPHWHGHVEGNLLTGASMTYQIADRMIEVPPDRLVLFWAGIPHRLVRVTPLGDGPVRLANIYLPVDTFLLMPHIARLQVALLGGALVQIPDTVCNIEHVTRWYRDYRANDVERTEVMKMEMNAALRRALLTDLEYLLDPLQDPGARRELTSVHVRHVVAMVRYIVENLSEPISNADVAAVTGLHRNYALGLFTRMMRMPVKQFVIRMRLLRARARLIESSMPIGKLAEDAGFASTSQFYTHFKTAYGMPPQMMRARYARMDLR